MTSVDQNLAQPDSRSESSERAERLDEPLQLVHHHAGYLRIRAVELVQPPGNEVVLAAARAAAEAVPGVRSWSHNPKTGSAVIEYEPGAVDVDDLLKHIAKSAGFRGVENATNRKRTRHELVSVFLDTVEDVNQIVGELATERADLRELVPIALAATSMVSFVLNDKRGRLPEWSGALYHSYRVFMQWHRKEVRTRERAGLQAEDTATTGRKRGDAR